MNDDDELRTAAANPEAAFLRLYRIVGRLRGPGGCPWDIEQTPQSLRGDLIEETYECIEALDEKESGHIAEELGDLFLLVTMLAYMHEEEAAAGRDGFSVADALNAVSEKLIRRHPHVFGKVQVKNSAEVLDNWAKIKIEQEGRRPKDSIVDEVSRSLPPLDRAYKLQKKAAKCGFDWPDVEGVIGKLKEELGEVEEELTTEEHKPQITADNRRLTANERLEEELGDLLFSAVNLCRFLKVEPSVALQRTNEKFVRRFKFVESKMKAAGAELCAENLEAMDALWNEAKAHE